MSNLNNHVSLVFGKKAAAVLMSTLLAASLLAGCAGTASAKTNTDYKGQTIYGEVTKVSSDSITIDVGTSNMEGGRGGSGNGGPGNESQNSSDGEQNGQPPEMPNSGDENGNAEQDITVSESSTDNKEQHSFIEKTGDTATITLEDDTEITKGGFGGPMGGRGNGQPPEMQNSGSDSSDSSSDSSANNGTPSGQPPEMPDNSGSSSSDSSDSSANNSAPSGQPPEMSSETIELSAIDEGDIVSITIDDSGEVDKVELVHDDDSEGGPGAGGAGQSNANIEYSAVKTYEEDEEVSGETVESTGDDENAILVKSGSVDFDNMTVTRDSDSSSGGDNASFYGLSAAVLGTGGTSYVSDSKITTDADGGAGVFSYGDGKVYVADTTIKTSYGASGGIHAAGGGTLYAWDLNVETAGQSSAAIRSDRGGGTMVVDGGTYKSTGVGSPAIYCTADISVNDAELTATGSEALCLEGKNTVRLFDSDLTGSMKDDDQNDCTWNVILYQSMSGDSEEGTGTFEMDGGSLTAENGGMFYTTNTSSKFVLKDVDITYADENDFFLKATGNSNSRGWGQSGSNGADCDFTAISQDMEGDVIWDKISTLDFYMTDGSTLTGAVIQDDSNAGSGKGGSCSVYIDSDSTWTVTGDSTVTSLYNAGTIKDTNGKTVTVKGTDGKTYVEGDSEYTITVDSYSTKDKTSSADTISSWSDYSVEKPSQLA